MTNNEAAKWIQLYIDLAKFDPTTGEAAYLNDNDKKTIEAMEMAIAALEKEAWKEEHPVSPLLDLQPCKQDDLISRAAAIDALDSLHYNDREDWCFVLDTIEYLPSAQPERKKGKWRKVSADRYVSSAKYVFACSECDKNVIGDWNYCPNCGSYNGGVRNDRQRKSHSDGIYRNRNACR